MIKKYKVAFPILGNYFVVAYNMLKNLVDLTYVEIMKPKKITSKTLQLGSKVSPDFVCVPFKYTIGNYIEALDSGANVLIQAGGGCRYGYYSEVQEQILKDMGYTFIYISFVEGRGVNLFDIYKKIKLLNKKLSFKKFIYFGYLAVKMVDILDKFETYIRENIVYETLKGSFEIVHENFLKELEDICSIDDLNRLKVKYMNKIKNIQLKQLKVSENIKVGIVGELYTSMEPFATFFLENELAKMGVKTKRYTTVTYLLFEKKRQEKNVLKKASKYIKYTLGADGAESVSHSVELIDAGYDGIIHIKPFGCTPEVNAMPILQKISRDTSIPIMYLTFDSQTSEAGLQTRIEAFYDMLKMKKDSEGMELKFKKENKVKQMEVKQYD
ncbi:MAG: hypothetical protein RSB76_01790 [Clostridia bacterium]